MPASRAWSVNRMALPDYIVPGVLAFAGGRLAVATNTGFAVYSFPSLALVHQVPDPRLHCDALQLSGDDTIVLAQHESLRTMPDRLGGPQDWGFAVQLFVAAAPVRTTALGPGNWRLAKGLTGDVVVVYDCTEAQGITALNARSGSVLWRHPGRIDLAQPAPTPGEPLLCFATYRRFAHMQTILSLDISSGATLHEYPRSSLAPTGWTSIAPLGHRHLLAGPGPHATEYHFTLWDPTASTPDATCRLAVDRVFSAETIRNAHHDDGCCPYDLCDVPAIHPGRSSRFAILLLGGSAHQPGSCHGGCAIATFDADRASISHIQVLDAHDAACASAPVPPDTLLVNCATKLYQVLLPPECALPST